MALSSVDISVSYDRSSTVIKSIDDVKDTLLVAFILVVIAIFIFMGRLTDTIIPGIILPLSIITTFLVMYLAGFSIDNLSLMAIILAIGFVVDDAIVVLENTIRHIEMGKTSLAATIVSIKEITGSVISMTLSIAIVFVPIIFLGGVVGRTFREFALTVIIIVICSGILSLTLTPMMNAHLLKPVSIDKVSWLQKRRDYILDGIIKKYSKLLAVFLERPYLVSVLKAHKLFSVRC